MPNGTFTRLVVILMPFLCVAPPEGGLPGGRDGPPPSTVHPNGASPRLLAASAGIQGAPSPVRIGRSPAPVRGGWTGTIQGTATIHVRPPRRTPRRYPGGGAAPAKRLQELPAVVYVKGATSARARASGLVMAQRDTAFSPGVLVVPRGASVTFPNGDDFFHNVFSYSGTQRFDLGRYPKGESKAVRFDEVGVVRVYCEVHEFMRAAILVTESGLYGVVDEDGSFSIPGVPAGRYTVVLWHADLGEAEAEVVVPEGGNASVELGVG